MKRKRYPGFTIVEVLIVIVILALLTTIISFAYTAQQRESRDEKRRSDLSALQHELERYYEENGNYPLSCDHGNSSTACGTVTSNYTAFYGSAPPTIGQSSTIADVRNVLPGMLESFGDPLSDGAPPINQHATGGSGHNIDRRSYLFFSVDMSNISDTARLATNASGSTALDCVSSPTQNDYRGVNKGNRSHPYVLGYYSEVEKKWVFIHGPKLDILNDLRWNNDNKQGCVPTTD